MKGTMCSRAAAMPVYFVWAVACFAANDESEYKFTVAQARKSVMEYCNMDCARAVRNLPLPCCDTFENAMRGDFAALTTVFTDSDYHSGDNESWSFTAWPLLHVVGDKTFAAYLGTLDAKTQANVFEQIFYEGSCYPRAIKTGYFHRKFPEVVAIYEKIQKKKHTKSASVIKIWRVANTRL
jgi:hypothetical protein